MLSIKAQLAVRADDKELHRLLSEVKRSLRLALEVCHRTGRTLRTTKQRRSSSRVQTSLKHLNAALEAVNRVGFLSPQGAGDPDLLPEIDLAALARDRRVVREEARLAGETEETAVTRLLASLRLDK